MRFVYPISWPVALSLLVASHASFASDDSVPDDPLLETHSMGGVPGGAPGLLDLRGISALPPPRESFLRTQEVFTRFGLPPEPEGRDQIDALQGASTRAAMDERLPYFTLEGGEWPRFSVTDDASVTAYQDRDAREVTDFQVSLAGTARASAWMRGLRARLSSNPAGLPLGGLRVALDPGHMGSDEWDTRTGKFVEGVIDGRRRKLSEGTLAVQTALLVERRLVQLGARVLITRRHLGPASRIAYHELDLQPYAREELRASSLEDWFLGLLSRGAAAFDNDSRVRAIFSERSRHKYFVLREDIDARARMIRDFEPDVTLVIHFDAHQTRLDTRRFPYTKAYVAGAFAGTELATRAARRDFATHLLHEDAWGASVALSSSVVGQLKARLGLEYSPSGGASAARRVRPGVFARNLALTRKLSGHALSYLEVMHYNDPREFRALLAEDHSLDIDGRSFPYSDRLADAAEAIAAGVEAFAAGLRSP